MAAKFRSLSENISITTSPTGIKVIARELSETIQITSAVSRIKRVFRALAETISITEAFTLSKLVIRSLAETISITSPSVTVLKIIGRVLAENISITETLSRTGFIIRSLIETISITDQVSRTKKLIRSLSETIEIATDSLEGIRILIREMAEEIIEITESATAAKVISRVLQEIISIHSQITAILNITNTWRLSGEGTDFLTRLDGLVIDYIIDNWQASNPGTGLASIPLTLSNGINIGNFDYDKFRSYYIKVTEKPARVTNRPRHNMLEYEGPFELEISVRKLSKGEPPQLQAIVNELIRIFLGYQKFEIFGIQDIDFDSISPAYNRENFTRHGPDKTVWKKIVKINLLYGKVDTIGSHFMSVMMEGRAITQ
jgi:hypothetical protein